MTWWLPPISPCAQLPARVVMFALDLDSDGHVRQVRVLRGHLSGAAIGTLKEREYAPARLAGAPVPCVVTVSFVFRAGHVNLYVKSEVPLVASAAEPEKAPPQGPTAPQPD